MVAITSGCAQADTSVTVRRRSRTMAHASAAALAPS